MSTRALCIRAWEGSQQMAVATGAIVMTAPAFVGYALALADGDVTGARCLVPEAPQNFRERVLGALDAIEEEEAAEQQPMAAGAGRR